MESVKLTRSDLPECGKVIEVFVEGRLVCVVNLEGELYAMDNVCPHWGGPLGQGTLENGKLRCPWHGWEFDPRTGETTRKAGVKVPTYELTIKGADVYIEMTKK
jgi:nitrite reductase/ring-hydroxylating ferredoxin subunit